LLNKHVYYSHTGFCPRPRFRARPGLGLIQRGGDSPVTCNVAVKALTSSSAAVANPGVPSGISVSSFTTDIASMAWTTMYCTGPIKVLKHG